MLTYFFLAAGGILLVYGGVSYFRYLNWKKTGKDAVAVYEELLSETEKKIGPFGKKTSLICKYRMEITSGGRITHAQRLESCENKAEARRFLGKKIKGLRDASGEFMDLESVDGLRKSAVGKLIAGAAGLVIALLRYVVCTYL